MIQCHNDNRTCYTITPIYRTLYRMSSTTESYLCSRTKERTRTRGKKTCDEKTWTDPGRTEEGSQHEGTRTRTRIQRMCYRYKLCIIVYYDLYSINHKQIMIL